MNDTPGACQSRRTDRSIFSAEKMQDRVVVVPPPQPKKEQHPHGCCSFFAYEIRTPDHLRAAVRVGQDRAAPNKRPRLHTRAIRWLQVPPPQPYCEAKKDIMASNPRNLPISGVFLAFPRFFATMRFADTECRKKDMISKNGSRQDVEQLSPAAKA